MRKILLIRLDELGDFVLWLDTAKEFKKIYPNDEITLLVNKKWYALAQTLPYWDDVVGFEPRTFRLNPLYRLVWKKFIKGWQFDIVISPRCSPRPFLEESIIKASHAKKVYTYQGKAEKHELINNAEFIHQWLPEFKASVPKLNKTFPPISYHDYCVICPNSYRPRKEWGLGGFLEIAYKIKKQTGWNAHFCHDKKINSPLLNHFGIDFSGLTSLEQYIRMISNAKLVIANDSAPIHLAVALGVPSVCIGSERYGRFLPYPDLPGVLPKLVYCKDVKQIPVDYAWEVVKGVLDGH